MWLAVLTDYARLKVEADRTEELGMNSSVYAAAIRDVTLPVTISNLVLFHVVDTYLGGFDMHC